MRRRLALGRWALAGLATLLAAAGGACAADAQDGLAVRAARVFASRGVLGIEVRLGGLWSARVRGTLERGMPASLMITADLWQHRSGWFDRMVTTRSLLYRVRYDAWREDYELRRGVEAAEHLDSLGAVGEALSLPIRFPVSLTRDLDPDERYYVVVTASLKPLTPEGVREVERFLSSQLGGAQGGGAAAPVVRLPSSLLSILAALSGLGDEIAVQRTRPFGLAARESLPAP
jgi:hypothetical protein